MYEKDIEIEIECSLDTMGIWGVLTSEQIAQLAKDIADGSENFSQGYAIPENPMISEMGLLEDRHKSSIKSFQTRLDDRDCLIKRLGWRISELECELYELSNK